MGQKTGAVQSVRKGLRPLAIPKGTYLSILEKNHLLVSYVAENLLKKLIWTSMWKINIIFLEEVGLCWALIAWEHSLVSTLFLLSLMLSHILFGLFVVLGCLYYSVFSQNFLLISVLASKIGTSAMDLSILFSDIQVFQWSSKAH